MDGMRRMYEEGEDAIYYITLENENYGMPAMPGDVEEGVFEGHVQAVEQRRAAKRNRRRCSSSAAAPFARGAAGPAILAEKFGIASDVWSVTSYRELPATPRPASAGTCCTPTEKPRQSYLKATWKG